MDNNNDFQIDIELVRQLVDGTIDDDNSERLLKLPRKDVGRFFQYIEVLQERVKWTDRILMRLGDNLYIVKNKENKRVTKCSCGQEFGDYRENWKLNCKVRIRKTEESMAEVYTPEPAVPEQGWQEIREFFCPNCATQLAVEVVAPGYPIVFEMFPDIDTFYRDYLGVPLTDESDDWYCDHTKKVTSEWAKG